MRNGHVGPGRGVVLDPVVLRGGFAAVSHVFVMECAAILRGLLIGLLIAVAIGAWVPSSFWTSFFLSEDPTLSVICPAPVS